MSITDQRSLQSTKLIALDQYFNEMIKLYDAGLFPKVLLLSGKKGIGKFTLVFHFLNYVFSKKEIYAYDIKEKTINTNSNFYNSVLNKTCADVIFLHQEEGKAIKIDDVRNLKSMLSKSTLSNNPRFVIIDEVELLNTNTVNALLRMLEEPSDNNYFILVNNQQTNLIETISSRCIKNNIYLNLEQRKKVINHLGINKKINFSIDDSNNLTPGLLLKYNELSDKYKIDDNENLLSKLNKLLIPYKKDKDKALINMSIFLIDNFFFHLLEKNKNKIDFLLSLKSIIVYKINDYSVFNLNINSVLNSIELELNNVKQ